MPYVYAFSVLLSAFLLFQVQPMIGKYILPWFGGAPAVWSTVLLFFQSLLTGGYAYAYWLLGRRQRRWQGTVHLIVLAVSIGLLVLTAVSWPSPLTPDASWRPQGSDLPIWDILKILAVAVGIPYLLLASNSTLVQGWFSDDHPGRTPYRLYALSNVGSLVALVSYPVIFEPLLTVRTQAYLWSAGYLVFAISTGYLALRTLQRMPANALPLSQPKNQPDEDRGPNTGLHLLWAGLATCASMLLLAVTSQITQEVAVIPFLWVVPLTIYLLTFILTFAGSRGYVRQPYLIAFFGLSLVSVWMLVKSPPFSITAQIMTYLLLLFVSCMICHNELYKLRPHPRFLPAFYLMMALGGALGGIFVTLLAPLVFSTGFWELQWGLVACGVLFTLVMQRERLPAFGKRQQRARARGEQPPLRWKPVVIASSVGVLILAGFVVLVMQAISAGSILAARNFYGVLRVWEINEAQPALLAYQLTHGKTVHGSQFEAAQIRKVPTTFYAETSGVGLLFKNHPTRPGNLRVGVLGLGIGTIASYGEAGDSFRFYEINPDVIRIAQGEGGYFSFLSDSAADVQVIPGDARVSLERELASGGPQNFDILVLDAFSGDAMPLHLLTQEAFAVYLRHLKPDGVIAINVSNRYFNLDQEVFKQADALGLEAALIEDTGDVIQSYDSIWMLLARKAETLDLPAIVARRSPRPVMPANLALWTDDFSNLLQILK
jgi:SAM-dependent methyltransferase